MSSYCKVHEINYKSWDCPRCKDEEEAIENIGNMEDRIEALEGVIGEFLENVDYYKEELAGSWLDIAKKAKGLLNE